VKIAAAIVQLITFPLAVRRDLLRAIQDVINIIRLPRGPMRRSVVPVSLVRWQHLTDLTNHTMAVHSRELRLVYDGCAGPSSVPVAKTKL